MDNWGEGVVPACREERPQRFFSYSVSIFIADTSFVSLDEPATPIAERPSTAPLIISTSENVNRIQRPSTGSSVTSSTHTPLSRSQSKKLPKIDPPNSIHLFNKQENSIKTDSDDRTLTLKDSSTEQTTSRSSFGQKPYYHDVLVIHTQPPKVNHYSN